MSDTYLKLPLILILRLWLIPGTSSEVSLIGFPATVTLPENSPAGTEVFHFKVAFSTGASMAAEFPRIFNSDPLTDAFIVFMENSTQVKITVTGTPTLDFEIVPNHFIFQILAVDRDGDSDLQTLTVLLTDIDEPPVFLDEASVLYIVEKSHPGEIYQPSVSDPENKPLIFSLMPPDPAFNIDPGKGSLFTRKEFNYQTDPRSYTFNLSVSDENNTVLRMLVIVIVNINDDKPLFLNTITSFTVPEELNPGHIVANITAVIPDDRLYVGFIFYTISTNDYFAIHRYTGSVTIAKRIDRDRAPLRDAPNITVTVTATFSPPGPPLSNSINLNVMVTDINDNPPICSPDSQRREVAETEVRGALITTVACTDNDVETVFKQFTFTELSCRECNQRFALSSPESNHIVLNGSLDFEDPTNLYIDNEYSLLVVAVDVNDTSLKGDAYVYVTVTPVNEFPPVFSPPSYFYSVSELLGSGVVIGSVNATDRDLPPTPIRYSLISGGGMGELMNIFHLDPKLGRITLRTHPDYEDTPTHTLVIQAVDGDPISPRSATTTVTINITEANDEPPLCGPNKTNLVVPTDLRTGSTVQSFILSCTDKDSPPSSFIYTISGASNVNSHFGFSPSAGTNITRLILREPFDYSSGLDRVWRYSLTVLISDANLRAGRSKPRGPAQTGTVIINVQVVDPDHTTIITTTTPGITYVAIAENTFDVSEWYVWFFITLGALLLLGMLAYLLYRCYKYLSTKECNCCEPRPLEDKEVIIPEKVAPKREILMEVTKINTVFDGEDVDPVTKRIYEYNSKSGARRWKDAAIVSGPPLTQPDSSTLVISGKPGNREKPPGTAQSHATSGRGTADSAQSQTRSVGMGWTREGKQASHVSNGRTSNENLSMKMGARPKARPKPDTVLMTTADMSEV